MRVFVLTCDSYSKAVLPFSFLFNNYFSSNQEVIVAGYEQFPANLPDNFIPHSIGKQIDYPLNKWSDGLIKLLDDFKDEVFLLFLEDYWIIEPVHLREVFMLYDYMIQFKYVVKMDMFTDRRYAGGVTPYGMCGHIPLLKSDPNSQYHMSFMCGLWNRENLLKILIPNEDPWQVELSGTSRLSLFGDELLVLGTDSWNNDPRTCPIRHTLAHRRGNPNELLLDELWPDDKKSLEELGYL